MRGRFLLGLVAAFCALALVVTFSGCTNLLGTFDFVPDTAANGAGCDAGSQCGTGLCVDGVCCAARCDGVCEACNVPGSLGTCAPIPDGQNPANECPTTPLAAVDPDAGLVLETDGGIDDAGTDAGDAGDAGVPDASVVFSTPDGGVVTSDGQCGGVCNGNRACRFAGKEKTCGTTFCTTPTDQARAACDGAGHCVVGSETCEAFSCADGSPGCKQTCTGQNDCLPSFYCDASSNTCKARVGNGSNCSSAAQCTDGHCVDGVCCNSACTDIPGGTCVAAGHVGECRCSACPEGTCQLFYIDRDKDGFGDKNGTIVGNSAKAACAGTPPTGYSATNDDCFDDTSATAKNVFPGQTQTFPTAYVIPGGSPSFDYDCDGTLTKATPEYASTATCGFCSGSAFSCSQSTSCSVVGTEAGLACGLGFGTCTGRICALRCTTVATGPSFRETVDCGVSRQGIDCGTCNGSTLTGTTYPTLTQACR